MAKHRSCGFLWLNLHLVSDPKSNQHSSRLQHKLPGAGPLDSLSRWHYIDRTASLLQSGKRPFDEGTRRLY
jgi:hypothetical protein